MVVRLAISNEDDNLLAKKVIRDILKVQAIALVITTIVEVNIKVKDMFLVVHEVVNVIVVKGYVPLPRAQPINLVTCMAQKKNDGDPEGHEHKLEAILDFVKEHVNIIKEDCN